MIDLTGEELMLAEKIVGETEYELEHNHEDDYQAELRSEEYEAFRYEAERNAGAEDR